MMQSKIKNQPRKSLHPVKTLISSTVAALIAVQTAHAGSFALYTESTAYAVGNYAAGIAAEAYDASTSWYNPAGLVLLDCPELVVGGVGVFPSSKLTGSSTFLTEPLPPYVQAFDGIDGAKNGFVPSLHYALPFTDTLAFGVSVISPFGLMTDWGKGGPVRYAASNSKFFTANVSPAISAMISPNFSAGLGVDLQYARVTFNSVLGSPAFMLFAEQPARALDSWSTNKGDSFGAGFHAGIMLMTDDHHSRLGINYQSQIRHKFEGHSLLEGPLASAELNPFASFESNDLYSDPIHLPDVLTVSIYHDLNEALALLGSVVYTGWETFSDIGLNRVAAFNSFTMEPALLNVDSVLDYKDTWRLAAGANYKINPKLMLRAGGGYDQTPTNNTHRDVRIPDCSRWALSVGAHYQARANLGVDVGYTHLFEASDATINSALELQDSDYFVNARARNNVDLFGLQVTWNMDGPQEVAPMK